MATVRPDWKMPDPPDISCPWCRRRCTTPIAFDEGDEWLFFWDCSEMHGEVPETMDMWIGIWPFEDDYANRQDMEALGFTFNN